MTTIVELDVVVTSTEIAAQIIGERRSLLVPAGTLGTVVLVHLLAGSVAAFEVEFHLENDSYALATVPANQVSRVVQS